MPARLVLTGPMGAGKSSIGRRVARKLGTAFIDTDAVIAREHGPISQIFADRGEPAFRELEELAVQEALRGDDVVALGGGAVLSVRTRELLRGHPVVFLTIPSSVVHRRISAGGRPLLAGEEDPVARWERIYRERLPLYREVADHTVDTSTGPISTLADELAEWVKGRTE